MEACNWRIFAFAIALAALSLPGCKTSAGISMRMILPSGSQTMDVPDANVFLMASPVSQRMPVFPTGASSGTEVNACVEIVVDESGAVSSATPIYGLPECPLLQPQVDQRFIAAVIESVKDWQFLAAAICTFPPGIPKTDDCSGSNVTVSPVAIKMAYVFSFQSSGRVTVKAKRA